jgi:hypothetical protein
MNYTDTVNKFKKVIDKREGKNFHQVIADKRAKSPAAFDKSFQDAFDEGKTKAKALIADANDFNSPTYEKSRNRVKSEFGGDKQKIHDHFTKEAVDKAGVRKMENRNTSYEDKVIGGLPIASADDEATVNAFKNLMRNKWDAQGYTDAIGVNNDMDVVNDFWASNSLSQLQNPAPGINKKATPAVIPAAY